MSAYINRYFLLMAVFLPLWCIIRRPWKHWSLHEGCLMAFAALLFSLLCLVLPLSIETCQLFIQRMTDVDDVLLNFAGGMIGGGLFALVHMLFPKFTDKALVRG